mmetsp:Transcript_6051/g.15032  ORF Transcript_6051/g.15032 Transcript_6051/m.15032 type:complete len:102 (-) Transcript_6051:145-450(-)
MAWHGPMTPIPEREAARQALLLYPCCSVAARESNNVEIANRTDDTERNRWMVHCRESNRIESNLSIDRSSLGKRHDSSRHCAVPYVHTHAVPNDRICYNVM